MATAYERLVDELPAAGSPSLTTLPDGSVDRYCSVRAGGTTRFETRRAFGNAILGDRSSFRFHVERTEPGGMCVNAAQQGHALGGQVTCYGHLDAPIFELLPFETVSMGQPADVYVFDFADRDAMLVQSRDVPDWTVADLGASGDLADVFDADAICCSNWVGAPGLQPAFHHLGDRALPRRPFVFDPGDVVGCNRHELEALLEAVTALQDTFDVVLLANQREVHAIAAVLPDGHASDAERLAAIRDATGVTAAGIHTEEEAAVATAEGLTRVPTIEVGEPVRRTGGGDRFSGGLGYALALGWDWPVALACGNACAARYVQTGQTGDPTDLAEFVTTQSLVE